jgi:hypothetical protein
MHHTTTLPPVPLIDAGIRRGTVIRLDAAGARVVLEEGVTEEIDCDLLHASSAPPRLIVGDTVLVWRTTSSDRGVLIGRIGPSGADLHGHAGTPDELVIEAKHSLCLRVGDGSITIREDGKILIKGKDLVSHAQRMNRIKGGAVSIN